LNNLLIKRLVTFSCARSSFASLPLDLPLDLPLEFLAVIKLDLYLIGSVHNMVVGQDVAVRADDETGTETLLPLRLRELLRVLRIFRPPCKCFQKLITARRLVKRQGTKKPAF
jgi:hypothetical protein